MTGLPRPHRISRALDMAGLFGPDADAQLGVAEPALDLWESGALVPTEEQLAGLAHRAGVAVEWFYSDEPLPEQHLGWACFRTRKAAGGDRCQPLTWPERLPLDPEPTQGVLW